MNLLKNATMKRMLFILLAILSTAVCSAGTDAMSIGKVRKETRFLTDKMAYELNLNTEQYNDVYEINYDFISGIRYLMDDVMRGYEWALDRYYDCLDMRNDDLRWVLSSRQYARFIRAEHFCRPIYTRGKHWHFRVYITYTDHDHFYFPRPHHYRTYAGGHCRAHHNGVSYYRGRYKHAHYNGSYRIRDPKHYTTHRRSDFGSIPMRPASTAARPGSRGNSTTTTTTTRRGDSSTRGNSVSRSGGSSPRRDNKGGVRSNTDTSRRGATARPGAKRKESTSSSTRSGNPGSSRRSSGDRR